MSAVVILSCPDLMKHGHMVNPSFKKQIWRIIENQYYLETDISQSAPFATGFLELILKFSMCNNAPFGQLVPRCSID